ncbi:hypothetical protein HID58_034065 [Brassica napus]|uniref:DUF1985 domain-containing protein n=1 Tax=Brassica napus TaxID=3708 RepID=A0ABQ8C0Z8_BRANA|nr:hypothetical protein HID58_034065 [Brassica napus]
MARKKPSFSQAKEKKKNAASQDSDPPPSSSGTMQPDPRLPLRLFATDRFPINKLNIYSSPEILPFLRHVLRDTKEFQTIRQSCFGKLFDIPSRQAPISRKLIHSFLSRQLICGGDHTLFSVFGGNPFRYGLQEFGAVTGLNCSPFTEGYHPDTAKAVVAGKDAIPQLLHFIPAPFDNRTLMDLEDGYLPQHGSINFLDIRRVEFSSNVPLSVSPVIAIENQAEPGWGDWPNKIKDDRLIYLEHLISEKYTFNKAMWPGGVTTEPLLKNPKARGHRHGNKKLTRVNQSLKPKPTIKKETSSRKQRRISSYFTRSNVNTFTNEQLTEMVLVLQKQMKQMQNLLNQKKRKAHGRQSSFHTVLSRCKKQRSSHHEDQGAPIDQDFPDTHQSGVETAPVKPLASDPPTDQVVDAMERDDHEDPQSPLISQYAAHIHRQASKNMNTTPDDIPNKTVHTTTVHASEVKFNHFWLSMVWKKKDTIHNSHFHCSVDHQLEPADDVAHEADIVPVSQKHISYDEVEPLFKTTNVLDTEDVDAIDNNREDVHNLVDQKSDEVNNDEQNITDQDVYVMDEETAVVHLHSQSTKTSHNGPDNGILKSPVRDETIQKPTETRTFGTLYPGRWDPPSKIYDKADHPNSPEISHILNHGLRIYDAISPDLPLSQGPIFDNTAGPSSLTAIHLRHATTPNAFKATASSISPPGIGRPTSAEEKLAADDPTVDLTQTKDPPPHVPSELEDLLAMEFIASPVIPALDLITPLPQKEWDLFQQILRANMNVFHCTLSEFEFSNKSLLDIAYPQQWTTTYAKHIEQTLHQLKILMDAKTDSCCTQDSPAFTTEATLASPTVASTAYNPLTNIAVTAIALGTMAWIYARLTN